MRIPDLACKVEHIGSASAITDRVVRAAATAGDLIDSVGSQISELLHYRRVHKDGADIVRIDIADDTIKKSVAWNDIPVCLQSEEVERCAAHKKALRQVSQGRLAFTDSIARAVLKKADFVVVDRQVWMSQVLAIQKGI